jgi:hypothetical protein
LGFKLISRPLRQKGVFNRCKTHPFYSSKHIFAAKIAWQRPRSPPLEKFSCDPKSLHRADLDYCRSRPDQQIGSWGVHLEEEHTLNFFKSENWYPILSCRKLFAPWQKTGNKDAEAGTYEKAGKILSRNRPDFVDERTKKEPPRIIEEG